MHPKRYLSVPPFCGSSGSRRPCIGLTVPTSPITQLVRASAKYTVVARWSRRRASQGSLGAAGERLKCAHFADANTATIDIRVYEIEDGQLIERKPLKGSDASKTLWQFTQTVPARTRLASLFALEMSRPHTPAASP